MPHHARRRQRGSGSLALRRRDLKRARMPLRRGQICPIVRPIMTTREALLMKVGKFIADHGLTERTFGLLVANDHKFVERLRHRSVTLARIEAAERFMAQYSAPPAAARTPAPAQTAV